MTVLAVAIVVLLVLKAIDAVLRVRVGVLRAEIEWRREHPEEAAAMAAERARAEISALAEAGLSERDAIDLWAGQRLAELETCCRA